MASYKNNRSFDVSSYINRQQKRIDDLELQSLGTIVSVTNDKNKFEQEIKNSSTEFNDYLLKFLGKIGHIIRLDKNCNEVKVRFDSDDIWLPVTI